MEVTKMPRFESVAEVLPLARKKFQLRYTGEAFTSPSPKAGDTSPDESANKK
jgi:hypothetical protein